jgi:aldose sugar dehydrogenase
MPTVSKSWIDAGIMVSVRNKLLSALAFGVVLPICPAPAVQAKVYKTADYTVTVVEQYNGLKSPWGMALLPDGRLLITQKAGSMAILSVDGRRIEQTIGDLPAVADAGQGGLLDVVPDPDFSKNRWLYWSYAEPGTGAARGLAGTAVARGRLQDGVLRNITVIFRQTPKVEGGGHFGSRLAFDREGMLYITLGERQRSAAAQDTRQSLGKVVRIRPDGGIPGNNPIWLDKAVLPGIYSYGHRNPQGAALHPLTGALWVSEHGPQGGDEINRIEAGKDYGWPSASYGCNYGQPVGEACRLGGGRHRPDYVEPLSIWAPVSIAPSGMVFYTGTMFPAWKNQVLMGALAGKALWRIQFKGDKEISREKMLAGLDERIRDVEQGGDGSLFLITDSGRLLRVTRLN